MSKPMIIMQTPFNIPCNNANSRDILKNWVKELAKFRMTPNKVYKTKILWKEYQYLVIFKCRLYVQESTETFPHSWMIMLDKLASEGKACNWSDMLVHRLMERVTRAQQPPKGHQAEIYMFDYILNAICAYQEFLGLKQAWTLAETSVNTYCKILSECSFRGVIT